MSREFGRPLSWMPAVESVAKQLARLPGIGPRMAMRLTFALLKRGKQEIADLTSALALLRDEVRQCSTCGNFAQADPCPICQGLGRDVTLLCVVEQPQDMLAIERTGKFNGLYHILGGALSPIDGIGPDEIGVPKLLARIQEPLREVILAANPTMEGDATVVYLQELLKEKNVRVTRLARGLPSGSDLEYADETTLSMALSSRTEL
jgi:recombination protein RecR